MAHGWVYAPITMWDICMYNLWGYPLVLFISQSSKLTHSADLLYCWCEFYAAKVGCCSFYRALRKNSAGMVYQMSVCLSVAFVYCELWRYWRWHALKIYTWLITLGTSLVATTIKPNKSKSRKVPNFQVKQRCDVKRRFSSWKSKMSETVR